MIKFRKFLKFFNKAYFDFELTFEPTLTTSP